MSRSGARAGLLGEVAWGTALGLYEAILLGQKAWWWQMHWGLWRAYRGWNPQKILEELPPEQDRNALAYGETPASTALRMLALCRQHLPDAESLLDLGAGRGVLAMAAAATDWEVMAIEVLPEFLARSEPLSLHYGWPVQWVQGDFMILPFPPCDVLHVAATTFPPNLRERLADRFASEVQPQQGIVTQDWVLDEERFETLSQTRLPVTWGSSVFTLHRRRP